MLISWKNWFICPIAIPTFWIWLIMSSWYCLMCFISSYVACELLITFKILIRFSLNILAKNYFKGCAVSCIYCITPRGFCCLSAPFCVPYFFYFRCNSFINKNILFLTIVYAEKQPKGKVGQMLETFPLFILFTL